MWSNIDKFYYSSRNRVRAVRSFKNPELICDSSLTYRWSTGSTQAYIVVSPDTTTTYTVTGTDTNGCSGIVELTVVVNHSSSSDTSAVACDEFFWHGNTYIESGEYKDTLMNAAGCDSVVTLHLTISHSTDSVETIIACDSLEWNGRTFYESTDTATFHTINAAGCDSLVTLHLTLHYSVQANDAHSGDCGIVADHDGNVYNTVQIGQQCWMKENLRTTSYADGTSIDLGTSNSTVTAYRYYPNNDSSYVSNYGYLYNWKAVKFCLFQCDSQRSTRYLS